MTAFSIQVQVLSINSCIVFWILKFKPPFRGEDFQKRRLARFGCCPDLYPFGHVDEEFLVHFRQNFRYPIVEPDCRAQ